MTLAQNTKPYWQFMDRMMVLATINPLSGNPTKWSNTLKQFVGNSRRVECLTILLGWHLKS